MKYALIGCGRISPNHIVAAQHNRLEIAALCDIDEKNMRDKILKFRLPSSVKCFTDYKEMLSEVQPDLVAIATESGKHAQIALDCITIGHSNLIIEKPIALSLTDADSIIQAAQKEKVKVCACHQKPVQQVHSENQRSSGDGLLVWENAAWDCPYPLGKGL